MNKPNGFKNLFINIGNQMKNIVKNHSYEVPIIDEFTSNANLFTGLYEPLYMLWDGKLKQSNNLLSDWDVRINNLNGADKLKAYWNKLFKNHEKLNENILHAKIEMFLEFMYLCGVKRNSCHNIKVEDDTYAKYTLLDGDFVELGETLIVKTPCWTLNNKIIEKGIVTKK